MDYVSTVTHESKIYPGVSFTIHKMSKGRRDRFQMAILDVSARLRELTRDLKALQSEGPPDDEGKPTIVFTDEVAAWALTDRIRASGKTEIDPTWLKYGLVSVDGITINGAPATVTSMIEDGPEDLVEEIKEAIQAEASLTEAERKNLQSPIISPAPGDGTTTTSSAESANTTDTGKSATA